MAFSYHKAQLVQGEVDAVVGQPPLGEVVGAYAVAAVAAADCRNLNGSADVLDSIVGFDTDRGFTMHEHLDEMGVIHMNGRIYDPLIGRFMSADPFIQHADDLQSYNRYAYVMNNPLSLTDPSGYLSFRSILAIAAAVFVPQLVGSLLGASSVACTAASVGAFGSATITGAFAIGAAGVGAG